MKNKEDQTKKTDNNSENEETKSQDEGSVQKVQRMDNSQNSLQKRTFEKMYQYTKDNEDIIGDEPVKKPKSSGYEEEQKKALKLQEYIDKIPQDVKERLTTQEEKEFYAHCSMYLDYLEIKFEDYEYLSTLKVIEREQKHQQNLNVFLKSGLSSIRDTYEDDDSEYMIDRLQKRFADYHNACVNKNIVLTPLNATQPFQSIKQALTIDLEEVVGLEISGEVVGYLEDFYYFNN